MAKISLPDVAYLRTAPALPSGEVYRALGMSRGRAYQLRTHNGFPLTAGGVIDTACLAAWLAVRGCRTVWI